MTRVQSVDGAEEDLTETPKFSFLLVLVCVCVCAETLAFFARDDVPNWLWLCLFWREKTVAHSGFKHRVRGQARLKNACLNE